MIEEKPKPQEIQYKYSFTPSNLSSIIDEKAPRTWGELAKSLCPNIFNTYSTISYIKQYENHFIALDVSFEFQYEDKKTTNQWKIFKNHQDFINLHQKLIKNKVIQQTMQPSWIKKSANRKIQPTSIEIMQNNSQEYAYAEYLNEISKSPVAIRLHIVQQFIQHCLPKDKYYLNTLGQVWFSRDPINTFRNKCFMFCCCVEEQASREKKYLTITKDSIMISDCHFSQGKYQDIVLFSKYFSLKFGHGQREGDLILTIKSHQMEFDGHFMMFSKLLSVAVKISYSYHASMYDKPHRFNSFSPIRNNCHAKMYIDGESYFEDLYQSLIKAKRKVCITGWIISPHFYLKRSQGQQNINHRFDMALQKAANNGAKIFILVYKEPEMFSHNDSQFVQAYLQKIHSNIIVLRHPNPIIPMLWTHHEKIVTVDEEIGFIGGLDIGFGRWDNKKHPVTNQGNLWPGVDYNNFRIRDITEPRKYENSSLNPDTQPRGPWHDIHAKIEGQIVVDLQRHFTQYWCFVLYQLQQNPTSAFDRLKKKIQILKNQDLRQQLSMREIADDEIKQQGQAKMEQNFISQWLVKGDYIQKLLNNSHNNFNFLINGKLKQRFHQVIIDGYFSRKKAGALQIQLLRSASDWSIGLQDGKIQSSIHNAYIELIRSSIKYIYIENQFFMSTQNHIVNELAKRILKAYNQKSPFKVIVVMPLLPGFAGEVTNDDSDILRHQMHLQYQSIKYRDNSLLKQLQNIPNAWDYIYFFGLRNHGVLKDIPKTQQIYVHSKLMIVDDETILVGSANINDRSLLGSRDSQIAIVIETKQSTDKIAKNLRQNLFRQHFDMDEQYNFLDQMNWKKLLAQSAKNTQLYRDVFGCIPDNTVSKFDQAVELQKKANISNYKKLNQLKGYVVDFPIDFVNEQNLALDQGDIQFYVPPKSYT